MEPTFSISQEQVSLYSRKPLNLKRIVMHGDVPPHDHGYYEISLIQKGTALHSTELYERKLEPGSVLVVPPGKVHAIAGLQDSQLEAINIYYLSEWLLYELRSLWNHDGLVSLFLAPSLFQHHEHFAIPQFSLDSQESAQCVKELDDLSAELEQEHPSILYLKSGFLKFLIKLSRAFVREEEHEDINLPFRAEVWTALEYIEQCLQENKPFQLADLAAEAGLSVDYLSKRFKESTGLTPTDYFQRRRIHYACNQLLDPKNSISDIVYALGYSDAPHFCRFFKRYYGMSPRSYRKMYLTR